MREFKNIDEYIADFPDTTREMLTQLRFTIKDAAPKAEEAISYGMPAFKLNGVLVYFAGYKNHIGFYPTGSGIAAFKEALADYKCSKGTAQFPLDRRLPLGLIKKIVKHRVKENLQKVKAKAKPKAK
jgi:uncharacterized protein YdhG (YjbR/CyaY superfamily)